MRALLTALVSLASGAALFLFAHGCVRGALGDALVVVFLVATLATLRLGTPAKRAWGVLAFAFLVEGFQALDLVGPGSHWLWHLTLGSTFDWQDLVYYAAGARLSFWLEAWWSTRPSSAKTQQTATSEPAQTAT
jgi:hypothetical protein